MTAQEAIDVLFNEWKCIDRNDGIHCDRKCETCDLVMDVGIIREAYNMAIAALQEQDSPKPTAGSVQNVQNEDLISRKMAIDAAESAFVRGVFPTAYIREIPSAQPETHEERTETHACDLISRQDAIDALDCISGVEEVLRSLPSAQPEPIRINLNEPIKVKLTDWGKEIYYHQYDRTNQIAGREICKPRFPREDENGYTEFQLWCFIELYGMHMGMTLPNVIEPLEIVYER